MKNSIILLLVLTTSIVFASCKTLPQDNSSNTESISLNSTIIYSELESSEETISSNELSEEATSSISQEQTSSDTPSSNNSLETSAPSYSSTCTHPDYWNDHTGLFWGWDNREPGIENKFTRSSNCEEPREVIYKCPICLEPVLSEILEPLGHDFSGEEEILLYPTVNSEGSWGIRCKGRNYAFCEGQLRTISIPKRGGSYDTIDSCFTVSISSSNNLERYKTENDTISISDYRTWGSVPTIEFDTETYTGSISYVLQDGSLYQRAITVDKTKLSKGTYYSGSILESGQYEVKYWTLSSNGTGPS